MTTVGKRDDVLFIGMNKFAGQEAAALRQSGAKVTLARDAAADDTITVGKGAAARTFDLTTDDGRAAFVKTLGLPQDQSAKIADVLKDAGPDVRDELAQVAQVWAGGEKGGQVPGRLVLSGHSSGARIYGRESGFSNGTLRQDSLTALAQAMPKAAAQVEDIAISACYAGGESNMDGWKAGFPNVKTVLGFDGLSPSGENGGSESYLQRWERATRGEVDQLLPRTFQGLEKAENVATWSVKNGYLVPGAKEKPEIVQKRIDDFQSRYQEYFDGSKRLPTNANNELRRYYNDLQDLASRPETSADDKTKLQGQIDQTIRLLKYDHIKVTFAAQHAPEIKAGYESLGLKAPNFATMSRAQALEEISKFDAALQSTAPKPAEAEALDRMLLRGLQDLDSSEIPQNWVG